MHHYFQLVRNIIPGVMLFDWLDGGEPHICSSLLLYLSHLKVIYWFRLTIITTFWLLRWFHLLTLFSVYSPIDNVVLIVAISTFATVFAYNLSLLEFSNMFYEIFASCHIDTYSCSLVSVQSSILILAFSTTSVFVRIMIPENYPLDIEWLWRLAWYIRSALYQRNIF